MEQSSYHTEKTERGICAVQTTFYFLPGETATHQRLFVFVLFKLTYSFTHSRGSCYH